MVLLLQPRPLSLRKAPFRFSVRVESGAAATAILWYKHDLRIEDHPGFIAASLHRRVVPLYVFDRRILSHVLRNLLKEKGSNLMIRFGWAEDVIGELVKEVQASSIIVEEEVEYELCVMLKIIKESLSNLSFKEGNPKIVTWRTPFYDYKNLKDLPSSFDDFKKLNLPITSPAVSPELPGTLLNLSWGTLPTLADTKKYMDDVSDGGNTKKEWNSINKFSAANLLRRKKLRGGSTCVLNALAAYLRYMEGTARDEWQERSSGATWLCARLLLLYLRFNIRNTLKSFYPTKTNRADDELVNEMISCILLIPSRSITFGSYDPGVIFVLESIFSVDLSLPLNYLLEGFEKNILVIQDPLSDNKTMLAMLREHSKGIAVKELDAGHCPHDELPNEVNLIINHWVVNLESPVASKQL